MRAVLLLALLAPLSAADPVTLHDEASGDCSTFGTGETSATVDAGGFASARAGGSSFCYTDPENGAFSSSTIFAQTAGTHVAWSGSTTGGSVYVVQGEDVRSVPAPIGPPNPGWGNLLP
jgi:hypothetical protein